MLKVHSNDISTSALNEMKILSIATQSDIVKIQPIIDISSSPYQVPWTWNAQASLFAKQTMYHQQHHNQLPINLNN